MPTEKGELELRRLLHRAEVAAARGDWPDSGFVIGVIEGKVYVKRAAKRANGDYALRDAKRRLVPGEVTTAFRVVQLRREV